MRAVGVGPACRCEAIAALANLAVNDDNEIKIADAGTVFHCLSLPFTAIHCLFTVFCARFCCRGAGAAGCAGAGVKGGVEAADRSGAGKPLGTRRCVLPAVRFATKCGCYLGLLCCAVPPLLCCRPRRYARASAVAFIRSLSRGFCAGDLSQRGWPQVNEDNKTKLRALGAVEVRRRSPPPPLELSPPPPLVGAGAGLPPRSLLIYAHTDRSFCHGRDCAKERERERERETECGLLAASHRCCGLSS